MKLHIYTYNNKLGFYIGETKQVGIEDLPFLKNMLLQQIQHFIIYLYLHFCYFLKY